MPKGTLFVKPDPDGMREWFRHKPKGMTSKLTSASEAIKELVRDGDYLAVGGFGTNRITTALLHEIMRQRRRGLGMSGHTATHDFQLMAAGGCIDRVDVAYVVGLEARGLSRVARRLFEQGQLEVTEWTNAALAWRYRAAVMGVPFLPARIMFGTDTWEHSAAKEVTCPFTGMNLAALPALSPDVALIHVHECDVYGNAVISGITVSDWELARASKRVIISTERLIPHEDIRKQPQRTTIPYFCVDAVVEIPYGSFPGNMAYEYFSDEEHLKAWLEAEGDPETLEAFVDRHIYSTEDFAEYLELCGGLGRMQQLRRVELLLDREGTGTGERKGEQQ